MHGWQRLTPKARLWQDTLIRRHLVFAPRFRQPSRSSIDWRTRGALIFAGLCVVSACSTTQYFLKPTESATQDVFYVSGIPTVSQIIPYPDDQFLFLAVRGQTTSELIVLLIYAGNETHDSFDVLPDKVEILGSSGGPWTALQVWDPFDYIRHVRDEQATARVLDAIASGLEAANAGQSTTQQSGVVSDAYGQPLGSYSTSSTTYDSSRVAEVQSRNAAERRAMSESQRDRLSFLDSHLLKRTTVLPGRDVFGFIFVERELYDRYLVRVPLDDSQVELAFTLVEL